MAGLRLQVNLLRLRAASPAFIPHGKKYVTGKIIFLLVFVAFSSYLKQLSVFITSYIGFILGTLQANVKLCTAKGKLCKYLSLREKKVFRLHLSLIKRFWKAQIRHLLTGQEECKPDNILCYLLVVGSISDSESVVSAELSSAVWDSLSFPSPSLHHKENN